MLYNFKDLTNQKFGRLTALSRISKNYYFYKIKKIKKLYLQNEMIMI